MKTYVLCIDGTWNAPGQTDRDPVLNEEVDTETNVMKTWQVLTGNPLDKNRPYGSIASLKYQVGEAIYLNGVGSSGSILKKKIDGCTGSGTSERIRDAYRFLAERWKEGDQIFGFGFSRGAFAVRSLIGFIERVGLPPHPSLIKEDELSVLFDNYKSDSKLTLSNGFKSCTVHFLGLWDTVGALAFRNSLADYHYINPKIALNVYHALALDEERKQFLPVHFTHNSRQNINEVWFAGAHSNVGGGYVDSNLSNISFFWILHKASFYGLSINLREIIGWEVENANGIARPSYNEFWRSIPYLGGFVENFDAFKAKRTVLQPFKFHESVINALAQGYKPIATYNNDPLTDTNIELWGI